MNRTSFLAAFSEKRRIMQRSAVSRLATLFGTSEDKSRDDDDDLPGPNATVPTSLPVFSALSFG